jgi:hypothetical protein
LEQPSIAHIQFHIPCHVSIFTFSHYLCSYTLKDRDVLVFHPELNWLEQVARERRTTHIHPKDRDVEENNTLNDLCLAAGFPVSYVQADTKQVYSCFTGDW